MSLREQFNAKQSRKRKRTTAEPTQVEKDAVRHFSTFSHLIRMHSLLYTSVAAGVDEIVTKAYEGDVPPRGHRWAKQKISGNCRTYKNDTLASMEVSYYNFYVRWILKLTVSRNMCADLATATKSQTPMKIICDCTLNKDTQSTTSWRFGGTWKASSTCRALPISDSRSAKVSIISCFQLMTF